MKKMVFVSALMSTGREVTQDQLARFQRGVTTQDEVIAKLGQPTSSTISASGQRELAYVFMHTQVRPETFIPIVGSFVGGGDTRMSQVVFTFDPAGKLVDYRATESNVGTGMGLAGGSYQTRTDQPAEVKK
jgi:outer membrane protein assembly factor BamE (lipoprotein component of BamABCDE complex)